jgi:hypothetical protein
MGDPNRPQLSTTATASTSTRSSGRISRFTSTILVVGRTSPKYSARAAPTASQSSMSTTNSRVRTTSDSDAPASPSASSTFASACRVWAAGSPAPTTSPSSSVAVVPETWICDPARTARE